MRIYFHTISGNILDTVFCVRTQFELTLQHFETFRSHKRKTNNAVAIIIDYYKKYTQLLNKIDKPCDNTNYKEMLSAC